MGINNLSPEALGIRLFDEGFVPPSKYFKKTNEDK